MRDQILHEVAQGLIPKAVDEVLRDRGVQPVETPAVRDVNVEEGQPLTFTATFETLPPVDPGEYRGITLRRTPVEVPETAVSEALDQLRERAARAEPVEGRSVAHGDTVTLDLTRRPLQPPADAETHTDAQVEVGAPGNPPSFDEHVTGLEIGESATFTVTPPEGESAEASGGEVEYAVTLKAIHQRVLPELNDDFARDLGTHETLDELRAQVTEDLRANADRESDRKTRDELLTQLAGRVPGEVPEALIGREVDRRVEHFVTQLVAQRVDPRRANINWEEFRDGQRQAATDTVKSTLVLDEIARKEDIEVTPEQIEEEIEQLASRSNRTVPAMRALIEKEGGVSSLAVGIRREKAIDFVLSHATIVTA
jgi:trigger factor